MKNIILRSVYILTLMTFCATGASAQGFLKKLKKATETVQSVVGGGEQNADTTAVATEDSISAKQLIETMPSYSVVEMIETDANGDTIRNEDQTVRKTYRLVDQNGTVCDPSTARKHLKAALKSGGAIITKVGIGTGAGLLGGLAAGGSKKDKLIGAGIGAAAGLLASTNDIKELKKQLSLRKECLRVIAQYQKDFTEEGIPVDANADLSAYQDCETVTKSAAQVAQELLASQEEGGSLEDYSDEELEKLLSEKEEA